MPVNILARQEERYSDIPINLTKHPVTGALTKVTDADAVKQSISNLIRTNFYERVGNSPTLAGNVEGYLFEPVDVVTAIALQNSIEDVIENHEPRAVLHKVTVTAISEGTGYAIAIVFSLVNTSDVITYSDVLERIR